MPFQGSPKQAAVAFLSGYHKDGSLVLFEKLGKFDDYKIDDDDLIIDYYYGYLSLLVRDSILSV